MKKLSCNQVDTGTLRVNVTNEDGEPVNADVPFLTIQNPEILLMN